MKKNRRSEFALLIFGIAFYCQRTSDLIYIEPECTEYLRRSIKLLSLRRSTAWGLDFTSEENLNLGT